MSKTTSLNTLLSNRKRVEGALSLLVLKNPDLLDEYRLKEEDFVYDDAKNILKLSNLLANKVIDKVDSIAIDVIFDQNKDLKEYFDERGGSKALILESKKIDESNFELFYDELLKQNYLVKINKLGFDTSRYAEKFKNATYNDVKAWIEYNLLDIDDDNSSLGRGLEIHDFDLTDEMIELVLSGELFDSLSIAEFSPILNSIINGVVLKSSIIVSAPSGRGKSTFVTSNMIYPLLKQGEKIILISNEMTFMQYMQMYISIISAREFNDYSVTRNKILKGTLDDGKEKLKRIQKYIRENITSNGGNIKFINYNDGNMDVVIRSVKKLSKLGYSTVIFDTMKPEDSSVGNAWGKIIEDYKRLVYTIQECNMALITPYQIAQGSSDKRLLSRADFAEGKGIITVASVSLVFRPLKYDEFDEGKYAIKPYKLLWDKNEKKWKKVKIPFSINDYGDKKFIILSVDKNRFGEDNVHILYMFDGSHAIFREIGMCMPHSDEGYKK